jgi:hypothetical protein
MTGDDFTDTPDIPWKDFWKGAGIGVTFIYFILHSRDNDNFTFKSDSRGIPENAINTLPRSH